MIVYFVELNMHTGLFIHYVEAAQYFTLLAAFQTVHVRPKYIFIL